MQKNWKDEVARDLVALGGLPFLVITIARVSIMQPYYPLQFIISSLIFFILRVRFKATLHAGIGLILVVFTSLYYGSGLFLAFALVLYTGIILSLIRLKEEKKAIGKGVLFGAVGAALGYRVVRMLFF